MSASESGPAGELLRRGKAGCQEALGRLLIRYGNYLALLARLQVGRRLQGKVDASDLVQETFLKAHRDFATFRGASEAEFLGWLRQILAATVAGSIRRYFGTQRRNPRLERKLTDEIEQSSQALHPQLASPYSTPSQRASRGGAGGPPGRRPQPVTGTLPRGDHSPPSRRAIHPTTSDFAFPSIDVCRTTSLFGGPGASQRWPPITPQQASRTGG